MVKMSIIILSSTMTNSNSKNQKLRLKWTFIALEVPKTYKEKGNEEKKGEGVPHNHTRTTCIVVKVGGRFAQATSAEA